MYSSCNNGNSSFHLSGMLNKNCDSLHVSFFPGLRKIYRSFSYFGHQLERFKDELQGLLIKYIVGANFIILFLHKFTIDLFFKFRNRLSLASKSFVVYSFSGACAPGYGVGRTHWNQRVSQRESSRSTYSLLRQTPFGSVPTISSCLL